MLLQPAEMFVLGAHIEVVVVCWSDLKWRPKAARLRMLQTALSRHLDEVAQNAEEMLQILPVIASSRLPCNQARRQQMIGGAPSQPWSKQLYRKVPKTLKTHQLAYQATHQAAFKSPCEVDSRLCCSTTGHDRWSGCSTQKIHIFSLQVLNGPVDTKRAMPLAILSQNRWNSPAAWAFVLRLPSGKSVQSWNHRQSHTRETWEAADRHSHCPEEARTHACIWVWLYIHTRTQTHTRGTTYVWHMYVYGHMYACMHSNCV